MFEDPLFVGVINEFLTSCCVFYDLFCLVVDLSGLIWLFDKMFVC